MEPDAGDHDGDAAHWPGRSWRRTQVRTVAGSAYGAAPRLSPGRPNRPQPHEPEIRLSPAPALPRGSPLPRGRGQSGQRAGDGRQERSGRAELAHSRTARERSRASAPWQRSAGQPANPGGAPAQLGAGHRLPPPLFQRVAVAHAGSAPRSRRASSSALSGRGRSSGRAVRRAGPQAKARPCREVTFPVDPRAESW
jgi:hypothetical protein